MQEHTVSQFKTPKSHAIVLKHTSIKMKQKSIQVNRSPDLNAAQIILNEQSSNVIIYF